MQWLTRDCRFIPSQAIPLVILDMVQQFDQDCHKALKGTRLFLDDILSQNPNLNIDQLAKLYDNTKQLLKADDTSFLLGQRLLPGNCGAASQALNLAPNLYWALELLQQLHPILIPLMQPTFVMDEDKGYVFWSDACGADKLQQDWLEACSVALVAYSRRLNGQHLPWTIHFRHAKPNHIEQYWVHLGDNIAFNQPANVMIIPRQYLFQQWQPDSLSAQLARQNAQKQMALLPADQTFLSLLQHLMIARLSNNEHRQLHLEGIANLLSMSPATLKRHIKKFNSHFQQQLDLARLQYAVTLMLVHRHSTESVADRLGFHDSAGFRRSFKRWTGSTPSHCFSL